MYAAKNRAVSRCIRSVTYHLLHKLVCDIGVTFLCIHHPEVDWKFNSDANGRYIFFADKVEVQDITEKTYFFSLVGPKANEVALLDQSFGTAFTCSILFHLRDVVRRVLLLTNSHYIDINIILRNFNLLGFISYNVD